MLELNWCLCDVLTAACLWNEHEYISLPGIFVLDCVLNGCFD